MAITVLAKSESLRTGTGNPMSWTHSSGACKAAIVGFCHGASDTDHVAAVTYGNRTMTRIQRNTDTNGETGAAELWLCGTGSIPTGAQTITASLNTGTTDDILGFAWTMNANRELIVLSNSGISVSTTLANPAIGFDSGIAEAYAFAGFYSGLTDTSGILAGTGCTKCSTSDLAGNFTSLFLMSNSSFTGAFTIAASAAADDVGFAAMAITEATSQVAQSVLATAITDNVYFRKTGKVVGAQAVASTALSRASMSFRQAVGSALQTLSDITQKLLDFDPSMIGALRGLQILWGRLGVPVAAPVGPQTFLQSLPAAGIASSSLVNVISFLRSYNAEVLFSGTTVKGIRANYPATSILTPSVTTVRGLVNSVAAALIGAADTFRRVGLARDAAMTAVAGLSKTSRLSQAVAAALQGSAQLSRKLFAQLAGTTIGASALSMARGMVSRAVSAQAATVAAIQDFVAYARTVSGQYIGTSALSRVLSLVRAMSAEALLTAVLSKVSTAAQTFQQAVDATALFVAAFTRTMSDKLSAEASFAASLVSHRGMVSLAISAIASLSAAVSRAANYARTTSAAAIFEAAQNKLMSLFRTLSGEAMFNTAIGRISSVAQTFQQAVSATLLSATDMFKSVAYSLRVVSEIAASLVPAATTNAIQQALSAVLLTVGAFTTMMTYARPLAAAQASAASLSKMLSLLRSLPASSSMAASLTATMAALRTVAAQHVGAAALSLASVKAITVAAALSAVAAIARTLSLTRSLSAEAIVEAAVSKLMSLFRTLGADASFVAIVARRVVGAVDSIHMAFDRMTGILRGGLGLSRHFSTQLLTSRTKALNIGKQKFTTAAKSQPTSKGSRGRTGVGRRGDGGTDTE